MERTRSETFVYPYDCASYVARARSIDRERERVEGFLENGLSVIGGRGEQSANQKKSREKAVSDRQSFGQSLSLNGA